MVYVSIVCVRISEELYSPSIGKELADDGKPHASHLCGDLGASHLYLLQQQTRGMLSVTP